MKRSGGCWILYILHFTPGNISVFNMNKYDVEMLEGARLGNECKTGGDEERN